MKRLLFLASLLVLGLSLGVAQADDPSAQIAAACSKCHSLDRVCSKLGADTAAWTTTISRMQGKGAAVAADQIPAWAGYLASLAKAKAPFCN